MWRSVVGCVIGCVIGCTGITVSPPVGQWEERSAPSGEKRLALVNFDEICGPSGHCESVLDWGTDRVRTAGGSYAWRLEGDVLRLCSLPCPMTLGAEETGAEYRWSELTQSYAWAGWVRLAGAE